MKDFYIREQSYWIKVTRFSDKSFSFAIGIKGEISAFKISRISAEFMPTIAEAKIHAKFMLTSFN